MDYLIYADVSIDIDAEFAKENDMKYIPMEYVLGEDNFYCKAPESNEMMHDYYEKLRQKITTHTSQITPSHYIDIFEPLVKEGKKILYISLSSGLSNTYESALMAVQTIQEDYENACIEVVDSLGATGGMGLMAEMAVRNREAGMDCAQNAAWLRAHANNVNYWFEVEDLMYLKRGGRVSAATAIMGTALNIKPILTIDKTGHLQTIDKKRGAKTAIKSMFERFEANFDEDTCEVVYVSCADCMDNANLLRDMILEAHPDAKVRVTMLSPIIGAHTGPDMVALIYFGSEREY